MSWSIPADVEDVLCKLSLQARERAYAPYSKYHVGAALLCEDGTPDGHVQLGCNVENVSYGLCTCAERTAVAAAVAAGHRRFRAIAIATASSPPASPCGACRQVLAEFNRELPIILVNTKGERARTALADIFPGTFTVEQLKSGQERS